jgi:hypothetical protein
MQSSLSTCPGRNDEAGCLVYPVECHVHKEEDSRKVETRNERASNDSEPSLERVIIGSNIYNPKKLAPTDRHIPVSAPGFRQREKSHNPCQN